MTTTDFQVGETIAWLMNGYTGRAMLGTVTDPDRGTGYLIATVTSTERKRDRWLIGRRWLVRADAAQRPANA